MQTTGPVAKVFRVFSNTFRGDPSTITISVLLPVFNGGENVEGRRRWEGEIYCKDVGTATCNYLSRAV